MDRVIATPAPGGAAVVLHEGERPARPHLDLPGVVTAVLGLVGLVHGLGEAGSAGWTAPQTLGPLAGGLVLLVAYVLVEQRVAHPLLPLRVVLDRSRGGARLAVAGVSMSGCRRSARGRWSRRAPCSARPAWPC